MKLYAIYKNGVHKGNIRAKNNADAIELYVIDSDLKEMLSDINFMVQYSTTEAIFGVHFGENTDNSNILKTIRPKKK